MLAELLEMAVERREDLINKIRSLRVREDTVKRLWIPYTPKPLEGTVVCGVDGSVNFKEFKGFSIFALSAEAVMLDGETVEKVKLCDLDILYPYFRTRERVRVYMLIAETLVALRACEKADMILLDGSIISNIARHATRSLSLIREVFNDSMLVRLLEDEEFNVRDLTDYLSSKGEFSENYILCIELLKYIMLFKKLIRKGKGKLISIAKTSQSTLHFKGPKPDIAVFERLTRATGFSKPVVRRLSDILTAMRSKLPNFLENFFKDVEMTTFYFRIAEGGPVLKAEVPTRLSLRDIERLLDIISAYSVMGYPYPLKKAHADSDIRDQDMECILRVLSLYGERTGREQHEVAIRRWY